MTTQRQYEEACEAGYDGPSPFQMKRDEGRRRENAKLDPRDPDYIDFDEGDICESCGTQDGTVRGDTDGICSGCYEQSEED